MHPLVRSGIDIHSYATTKLELPAPGSPANNQAVISKVRVFDRTLTMLSWAERG